MQLRPIDIEMEHPSQKSYSFNKITIVAFVVISLAIVSVIKVFI